MPFKTNQVNTEPTKKCIYCKKDIPEDAIVCYHCLRRQDHLYLHIFLAILAVLMLLFIFFSCRARMADDEIATPYVPKRNTPAVTEKEETTTPTNQKYSVGSVFDDQGIEVKLDSVKTSAGDDETKPAQGNIYLIINWTITNTTDKEIVNPTYFDGYIDGKAVEPVFIYPIADAIDVGGMLIPGSSMTGSTSYEVPTDWKQFQIRLSTDLSEKSATFEITPSQVS